MGTHKVGGGVLTFPKDSSKDQVQMTALLLYKGGQYQSMLSEK